MNHVTNNGAIKEGNKSQLGVPRTVDQALPVLGVMWWCWGQQRLSCEPPHYIASRLKVNPHRGLAGLGAG